MSIYLPVGTSTGLPAIGNIDTTRGVVYGEMDSTDPLTRNDHPTDIFMLQSTEGFSPAPRVTLRPRLVHLVDLDDLDEARIRRLIKHSLSINGVLDDNHMWPKDHAVGKVTIRTKIPVCGTGSEIDLPEGCEIINVIFEKGECSLKTDAFLFENGNLIPLHTYLSAQPNHFRVIEIDRDGAIIRTYPISEYILERLRTDKVTLHRVLSEDEVAKWATGEIVNERISEVKGRIFVSLFNVTNEFYDPPEKLRRISFEVDTGKFKRLVKGDHILVGNYAWVFHGRENQLFPVDFEARVVSDEGRDLLMEGYNTWREGVGRDSVEAPSV